MYLLLPPHGGVAGRGGDDERLAKVACRDTPRRRRVQVGSGSWRRTAGGVVENGNGSSPPLVLPNEMNAGAGSLINLLRGPHRVWMGLKKNL